MSDDPKPPGRKLPMPKSATGTVLGVAPARLPDKAPSAPVPAANATILGVSPARPPAPQPAQPTQPVKKAVPNANATVMGVGIRPPEAQPEPQPEPQAKPQAEPEPEPKRQWRLDDEPQSSQLRMSPMLSPRTIYMIMGGVALTLLIAIIAVLASK